MVQLSTVERAALVKANDYYAKKGFEYLFVTRAVTAYRELPELSALAQIAQNLVRELEAICRQINGAVQASSGTPSS